jgi:hypothetical protein
MWLGERRDGALASGASGRGQAVEPSLSKRFGKTPDFSFDLFLPFLNLSSFRFEGAVFLLRSPFSSSTDIFKNASFWLRSDSF